MKTANLAKAVCVAGLAATCVLGLASCTTGEDKPAAEGYTGGVAATVNGTEIPEDTITAQIQMIRAQMSVTLDRVLHGWPRTATHLKRCASRSSMAMLTRNWCVKVPTRKASL